MNKLSHLNEKNLPSMVDVGSKVSTQRVAKARAVVYLGREIIDHLCQNDNQSKKGPVFQTAIVAGIMAAKKTGELIPLCHPLGMDHCDVDIKIINADEVEILCTASIHSKTGIEMEALTGASVAALTIYDMCKAMSHHIVVKELRLVKKTGGKKDFEWKP